MEAPIHRAILGKPQPTIKMDVSGSLCQKHGVMGCLKCMKEFKNELIKKAKEMFT